MTISGYTQQARKLAAANDVRLVGRDELVSMILGTPVPPPATPTPAAASVVPAVAPPEPDQIVATCARCGVQ